MYSFPTSMLQAAKVVHQVNAMIVPSNNDNKYITSMPDRRFEARDQLPWLIKSVIVSVRTSGASTFTQ